MKPLDIENKITFKTIELKAREIYEISWNEIITVVSWKIEEETKQVLVTFESSCYYSWNKITALENSFLTILNVEDKDIFLNKINVENTFWEFCRNNWKQLRQIRDVEWFEKVDLYRWDQLEIVNNWIKYKFNLWFCWKNVDCLFHKEHNFIEVHTNIAWDWYMQKSFDWTDSWLCETVWLLPWNSHRKFNKIWEFEENWNPKYPFHRWLWWNTWNVWLVIEKYN